MSPLLSAFPWAIFRAAWKNPFPFATTRAPVRRPRAVLAAQRKSPGRGLRPGLFTLVFRRAGYFSLSTGYLAPCQA